MKSYGLITTEQENKVARQILTDGEKFKNSVEKGVREADARVKKFANRGPKLYHKIRGL